MPGVKNQHYVPRFYLRSFTDDTGHLYAVRRDASGLGTVFRAKPERICVEKYLYEVKRRMSEGNDGFIEKGAIEDALGKIENELAPVYQSLLGYLDSEKLPNGEELVDLITQLAALVASLIVRNPIWLKRVRDSACVRSAGRLTSVLFTDEDIARMESEGYRNEIEAIVELAFLDTTLLRCYKGTPIYNLLIILLDMDCRFCIAPEGSEFITTSLPVYVAWKDEHDEKPFSCYFPLSPRYAVVFKHRVEKERCVYTTVLLAGAVDSLNRTLMNCNGAWEFLIAGDQPYLNRLIQDHCGAL